MKSFSTAAKQAAAKSGEEFHFDLDGKTMTCYRPEPEQWAVTMAGMGRFSSMRDQAAAVINFFVGIMDEQSASHITERLLDRTDPFGLEEVQNIFEWLTEAWSGNPTESPSASTGSQKPTGPTSTDAIPV